MNVDLKHKSSWKYFLSFHENKNENILARVVILKCSILSGRNISNVAETCCSVKQVDGKVKSWTKFTGK